MIDLIAIYNLILGNKYYLSAAVFVLFYLGSYLAVFIIEKVFMKIAAKTETQLDDLILDAVNKHISTVLIIIGLIISLQTLSFKNNVENSVEKILLSILIIFLGAILHGVVKALVNNWGMKWAEKTESDVDDQVLSLFNRFSIVITVILVLLFILITWGIKVGPLLTSLGIAGIAVAFALQNTLSNIFGGISMIVDKSIKVGDIVEIDQMTSGKVIDVGIRSTKIRNWNNEIVIVPNGILANSKIVNYVLPDITARVVVPFTVAYGSDVEKVKKIVLAELKKVDGYIKDPEPVVRFDKFGDSALNFKAYFYIKDVDKRLHATDMANTLIYNALNKNNIEIPYPHMDLHIVEKKDKVQKRPKTKDKQEDD